MNFANSPTRVLGFQKGSFVVLPHKSECQGKSVAMNQKFGVPFLVFVRSGTVSAEARLEVGRDVRKRTAAEEDVTGKAAEDGES